VVRKHNKNPRKTMYKTNKIAVDWMLKNGFDHIVLFTHTRRGMPYRFKDGAKTVLWWTKDLFGLFDGLSINKDGFIFFLQFKTNAWPATEPINKLLKQTVYARALAINVIKGHVRARLYDGGEVREITPNIKKFTNYEKFCENEGLAP